MKLSKKETKELIAYAKHDDKVRDKMVSDMGHDAINPTLNLK